jgi:hypothetical protein
VPAETRSKLEPRVATRTAKSRGDGVEDVEAAGTLTTRASTASSCDENNEQVMRCSSVAQLGRIQRSTPGEARRLGGDDPGWRREVAHEIRRQPASIAPPARSSR